MDHRDRNPNPDALEAANMAGDHILEQALGQGESPDPVNVRAEETAPPPIDPLALYPLPWRRHPWRTVLADANGAQVLYVSLPHGSNDDFDQDRAAAAALCEYIGRAVAAYRAKEQIRPWVVCLCGSTRFKWAFLEANFRETLAGRIVLSVGCFSHADAEIYTPTEAEKAALDELHLRKIEMSDEILVLNVPVLTCHACRKPCEADSASWSLCCRAEARFKPYIGDSTRREIEYAASLGKTIRYLEG